MSGEKIQQQLAMELNGNLYEIVHIYFRYKGSNNRKIIKCLLVLKDDLSAYYALMQ